MGELNLRGEEKIIRTAVKLEAFGTWIKWVMITLVLLAIAFGIGFLVGKIGLNGGKEEAEQIEPLPTGVDKIIEEEDYKISISSVEAVLKPTSDLIATKYFYKDADTYEDYKEVFGKKIPFTTDTVVFTYEGVISVGIDLSEVDYDIDNKDKTITIELPSIKVLSNEIDHSSFEYPYVSDSVFNKTEMQDYTNLIDELKKDKEEEIIANEAFMKEAEKNVMDVLKNFLTVSEVTKDYKVVFE